MRVLFVCSGNVCRSPMAEAWLRHRAERHGLDGVEAVSAGTLGIVGRPAAAPAIALLAEHGVDLSAHRSQALTRALLEEADRVFALDRGHLEAIAALCPEARDRTELLGVAPDAAPGAGAVEVPDPIGRDRAVYARAFAPIRRGVDRLVDALDEPEETGP